MKHTADQIRRTIEETIARLPLDGAPPLLYQPIRYAMSQGGKRLRPTLLMLAAEMYGADIQSAVWPAIGLEVFHNFTLVHDDIMDQSPIRRGVETVYKKWTSSVAILSGDTMFALAYDLLIRCDSPHIREILHLFNRTAIEVCEGQQLDMDFELQKVVDIDEYMKMIRLKTAVLLAASLKTGALIADVNTNEAERIYDFGINIGLAFQLMDDLLDVYSEEALFGKKTGNDIVTNKKTFLYLKAFELADSKQQHELEQAFAISSPVEKVTTVRALYDDLGVREATLAEIQRLHQISESFFDNLPAGINQSDELHRVTLGLVERKY
ncbi:MAG: isoprenyl synthetase [Bacteroidetes bacterium HGW-Bacteroidetes-22]|nr:MAG: isoprenyl synthetase [Bacteroidetes bacterium HGW-Bacteroidetes-22]